jgi:peptidoglycan hydrolase CwlO-like protein
MTLEGLGVFLGVLAAFITGVGGLIISLRTSLNSVSQKELKAVHEENERLRKQITALDEKLSGRDATIEQMRADFSARLEEREARIELLESQVETLEFRMREVMQENELLRGTLERYEAGKDGAKE